VLVEVGATRDVLDALLKDPKYAAQIEVIDLRGWWYKPDGTLFAPPGGRQVAGRYTAGYDSAKTTPEQVYRQIREYRDRYPQKAIVHQIEASRQQTWAFLMGGGSLLTRRLEYPHLEDPPTYIAPEAAPLIQPAYDFLRTRLATELPRMRPADLATSAAGPVWCLADKKRPVLVYALKGGRFQVDLRGVRGRFRAQWLNPRTGKLTPAGERVPGTAVAEFTAPDGQDWALWRSR